jgi:hypothetical protein
VRLRGLEEAGLEDALARRPSHEDRWTHWYRPENSVGQLDHVLLSPRPGGGNGGLGPRDRAPRVGFARVLADGGVGPSRTHFQRLEGDPDPVEVDFRFERLRWSHSRCLRVGSLSRLLQGSVGATSERESLTFRPPPNAMKEQTPPLRREDLAHFYDHYASVVRDELTLGHQYLNFYVGLIAAILGATLVGLLEVSSAGRAWIGPARRADPRSLTGRERCDHSPYFHRRFTTAWVTLLNVESMLGFNRATPADQERVVAPRYPSKVGGFMAQLESP